MVSNFCISRISKVLHSCKKAAIVSTVSAAVFAGTVGLGVGVGIGMSSDAYAAAHSTYNPMQPRQLSAKAALADYSYGYSILSGSAIDSLEEPNRAMWYLNYDIFDHYILRPVAHGYAYLPQGFRNSMGNFFSNLDEINNIPNNLLVGRPVASITSVGRLVINSTIGILGFFDVASYMGLQNQAMNMETVLGKGGVQQGPFFMIPAYGPTTARDIQGAVIDGAPWYAVSWPITIAKWAVQGVHNRSNLIAQEDLLDNSIDPYITTRDAYLMYDENEVNPMAEGEVEAEDDFDEALLEEIDG